MRVGFAVIVMSAEPSKGVLLINLGICRLEAVSALPIKRGGYIVTSNNSAWYL